MIPAPFMRPLGSRDYRTGNIYEMAHLAPMPRAISLKVLEAWGNSSSARAAVAARGLLYERTRRSQQIHPYLAVQGSQAERTRGARGIAAAGERLAAAERGTADPPGEQAADARDLLARTIVCFTGQGGRKRPLTPPGVEGRMEIGASIFFTGYPICRPILVIALEQRGFDSLWVAEHCACQ